ncbi:CRISPR-associated helicase Cas3' [Tissierella sp. MSJ-40]|uniref:CRISPR-associated helicase Cas3 n=1 Tax=Tissierella simiarum TaxID=2841534 RepID=A0ABS6E9V8_9FIRM|nr:CRISPR-associated helicase Cas3' [Tissierella simiarum]MBU5439709.1 CRISPR-associated helicase Cas3' [Tissierella simiarum]
MKNIPLYDLEGNIKDIHLLLAHLNKNKEDETLYEHLNKTIYYFYKINELKGIEDCIDNIISKFVVNDRYLSEGEGLLIKEMFVNAIYLHDIGKINPAFQKNKMKNEYVETITNNSEHSLMSALIYLDIYDKKVKTILDRKVKKFVEYLMYLNAYCISKHHSYLRDLNDFLSNLETLKSTLIETPEYIEYYINSSIESMDFTQYKNPFESRDIIQKKESYCYGEVYVLMKLLYSSIVTCDFYSTYDYMNEGIEDFGVIEEISSLINEYENSDIYASINKYKAYISGESNDNPYENKPINRLRTEMFLESEKNLKENIQGNIFYLEAPTGSGKTNTSINLALKIIEKDKNFNKIFYIFPFNTLIEQTQESLNNLFNGKGQERGIAIINSITPVITNDEQSRNEILGSINYEKYLLNRQFLHYPIVLTTHINFFNYLFGIGKEVNFPLLHLCNSVIIIDEVQSYRNDIWKEIIMFLDKYAKLLNIKIIIMSATLPKLDKLIGDNQESNFIELIKDKDKYYNHELFKNRVDLNYDLLEMDDITIEDIVDFVDGTWKQNGEARMLIEFITKKDARIFFNKIVENNPDKLIVELTGDDNKLTRRKILNNLKYKENGEYVLKDVLIVATQVIEAGVDIDMDIGFKDISILDSEEQFLGRINRSCENKGEVYFFNLRNPRIVYKNDHRVEMNLVSKEYQTYLENKDFEKFYIDCFERMEEKKNQFNVNNIENILDDLRFLRFENIYKKMKLIQQESYQIYLPTKINDDYEEIDGKIIWEKYLKLITDQDLGYAEKKVKLSQVYEKMNYFLYNVHKEPRTYKYIIGNIYYIENGEDYITEGKFDREKFEEKEEGLFL